MKALWSQWMHQLGQRVPERTVLLVPAHFFYGHRFAVPPGMPAEEVPGFLELSLEGVSPFPLEQLAWGFVHEPEQGHAYTFATSISRLRTHLGDRELESFHFALPGFLSQYGVTFSRPTVRFLAENGSISALVYERRQPLPLRIVSREIKAEVLTDDRILEARDQLAKALPREAAGAEIEEGVWLGDSYMIDAQDRPAFFHDYLTRQGRGSRLRHNLALSAEALWNADLRDRVFQHKEKRDRRISHGLWWGVKGLGLFACLLLLLQVSAWGVSGWVSVRQSKVAQQAPAVSRIEQSEFLAHRLVESADRSLDPVRMLEIVNDARPDAIFFTRTESNQYNQLQIQGQSNQGIPTVNAYEQTLRRLPAVRDVQQSARTQVGRTTFEMTVHFHDHALGSTAPTATVSN